MNKKGFAISIILYSMVFLLVSIFYMLLGISKNRYTVSTNLRESIIENMNTSLYDRIMRLCEDTSVSYVNKYKTSNGAPIDTPNGSGNEQVCYYTSSNTENLAGKNGNVIFGEHCWQIVRTTADGGIKLIYNGPAKKDVTEVIEDMTDSNITYTNDATYPFSYNSSTKEWTSTNHIDSKTSTLLFNVKQNGDYKITYSISSEDNYDKGKFYKNGTLIREDSGTKTGTITLDGLSTSDVIKVEYYKDGSTSRGTDDVTFKISRVLERTESTNLSCNDSREPGVGVTGSSTASATLSGNKLFGTTFTINGGSFKLNNTFTADWTGDYDNDGVPDSSKIIGNFVCVNGSSIGTTDTCETIHFIGLQNNNNISAYTAKFTIGTNDNFAQIGKGPFMANNNSVGFAGYMYTDSYRTVGRSMATAVNMYNVDSISNNSAYYFGDNAVWNTSTNQYDLKTNGATPTSTQTWGNIRSSAGGKYTCLSSTATSCASVKYIVANSTSSAMYSILLSNNENANKSMTWKVATSYTTSGSNYVLTNPTDLTIVLKDWYTGYSNASYKNIYVCSDYASTTCSELYYIGATTSTAYNYSSTSNAYILGNSVSYSNGSYSINSDTDPTKYQNVWNWYTDYNKISKSHYTCFKTDTNNCGSSVYYIHNSSAGYVYYVELENNDTISSALQKMINNTNSSSSNINRYNSAIKGVVDSWYKQYIGDKGLTQFLDTDSVFCSDRSVSNYGGWDPNTGTDTGLRFKYYSTASINNASLACNNITDRFSVSNNKAKLTYPIGLLTEPERALMNTNYIKTGSAYLLLSPYQFSINSGTQRSVATSGGTTSTSVNNYTGIRPVIVLKSDVSLKSGNGTYDKPYIIDTTGGS